MSTICDGCWETLELRTLQSAAGYYVGYLCSECGPYDRTSDYFSTESEAQEELAKQVKDWKTYAFMTSTHWEIGPLTIPGNWKELLENDGYKLKGYMYVGPGENDETNTFSTIPDYIRIYPNKKLAVVSYF